MELSNPKIFFVNGVAQSGKDTFVDLVQHYAPVAKISSIDEVKDIASFNFGWDGEKDENGRALLSAIKNAWTAYNDGPANNVGEKIAFISEHYCKSAIFVMVREFDEMIKMQKMFGGKTLLLVNDKVTPGETEREFLRQVPEGYEYDITVKNNGPLGLLDHEAGMFVKHYVLVD